jgi:double-strand break repair protein MRE11
MLSVAGLINYMGKFDLPLSAADAQSSEQPNGITVRPVLLRKGNTRLGMYGVGNVKDQRMHFELRSNRVRMFMPKDKDDWFNILLVHQNRCVELRIGIRTGLTLIALNVGRKNTFPRACLMIAWT